MRGIKINSYTFDASDRKVTFTDYTAIRLDAVLLIVNVTDQKILYSFANEAKGGTVATNVLTLEYDTTAMSDTDSLLIIYDDVAFNQNKSNFQLIAEGNIPGVRAWTKNGYNAALSTAEETLWAVGGAYVYPTAAMQMEVVSSSANDTALGSGARTVEITYLDVNYIERTEIVSLSGITSVPTTATNILRVNNFRVKTTGTGYANAGNIDIRHIANTPIYSRIATGTNRAVNCVYTVPAGKTLYVYNILFSAGGNVANRPVRFITKANYDHISGLRIEFFMPLTNTIITDGTVDAPIEIPTKLIEKTDVYVNAISPDGETYGAVTTRGYLVNN